MTARRAGAVVTIVAVLAGAAPLHAQGPASRHDAVRVAALLGLARSAQARGRHADAVRYYREADRRQALDAGVLEEYFWAAHAGDATTARLVGRRLLRVAPHRHDARDALIGLEVSAGNEAGVRALAAAGAALDPGTALWPRRLAESHLRSGAATRAAEYFARAANKRDGEPGDLAQRALALEAAAQYGAAARAWQGLDASVWNERPEWAASRRRTVAAIAAAARRRAPLATRAPAPPAAPIDVVAMARRGLAVDPCAVEPLDALNRLPDPLPLIDAVQARPATCAAHAIWLERAGERAIAVNAFERALAVVAGAASASDAPAGLREMHGALLHWTGRTEAAVPVLRDVLLDSPGRPRAVMALADALRALGDPDGAWSLAEAHWRGEDIPAESGLLLAELALETGRPAEALAIGQPLRDHPALADRARAVTGTALLRLGREAELGAALDELLGHPAPALAWLEGLATREGVAAALAAANRLPDRDDGAWAEVVARRALWQAQVGQREASRALLERLKVRHPDRAELAEAEVALALGRPADAETRLRSRLERAPADLRALDLRATALAEQGRWDEALVANAMVRARRPHEARWAVREAEWADRRQPTAETLAGLERVAAQFPASDDARLALARAYARAGQFSTAVATLGPDPGTFSEAEALLAARSLRALGRLDEALSVLDVRGASSTDLVLARAEIVRARDGVDAADQLLHDLVRRPEAEPAWYRAWADLHDQGTTRRDRLAEGARRFPGDAGLHEQLAMAGWALGDLGGARAAAEAVLAIDDSRTESWFVAVTAAQAEGRGDDAAALLSRFGQRFGGEPSALLALGDRLAAQARTPTDPMLGVALSWARDILERNPNQVAAVLTSARLVAAQGHLAQALDTVDALVAVRPDLVDVRKLRADLLLRAGRYGDAVAALDDYLALAPRDVSARRLQARMEGWRGRFAEALRRYDALAAEAGGTPAIAAEMAAKRAYYHGRWQQAVAHYDRWLALEPEDTEARLERAQALDQLGDARAALQGFAAAAARAPESDVPKLAMERIARRRAPAADLFATVTSANGPSRNQLLDLVDTGAGLAGPLGAGFAVRGRAYAGPSVASDGRRRWSGAVAGADVQANLSPSLRLKTTAGLRTTTGTGTVWTGALEAAWQRSTVLRVAGGVERALVLENAATLTRGLAASGPAARVDWRPTRGLAIETTGSLTALTDGNGRGTLRLAASQVLRRGVDELRVWGQTEYLGYRDGRTDYFAPGRFWRHDIGPEWRRWLSTPRFTGDRERWISAAYRHGWDNRGVRYHTVQGGLSYELTNGIGLVADGYAVRSRVYDGGRLSIGLRLRQVTLPR